MDKKSRKQRNDKGKRRGPMSIETKTKISLAHMEKKYRPGVSITKNISDATVGIPKTGTGKLDAEKDILTQMGVHFGINK